MKTVLENTAGRNYKQAMKNAWILVLWLILAPYSVAHAMSYAEEREVASQFIDLLERNNLLVHDEEITQPVDMVAQRLADHIPSSVYRYTIHVVRDRSVNAFTIPDGHIFVNTGLLLFAQDMDEIAAVIAHEMGHAQLRHIPSLLEAQTKITAATILGVLAGTILSSKNPEAGAAMVFSSLGGGENIRLAFSRQHEYAADEFGAKLLIASGISPSAMTRFLVRLNATSGPSGAPEYLLTHPFTQNRITAIGQDPGKPSPNPAFWTLQACISGLMLPAQEAELRSSNLPEPYRSLALGILKTRYGDPAGAVSLLEKIEIDLARAYTGLNLFAQGKIEAAYPLLKAYPASSRLRTALAEILAAHGSYAEAITLLEPDRGKSPRADYLLGVLYEKAGKTALSHASYARYFARSDNPRSALYHVEAALALKKDLPSDVAEEMERLKGSLQKQKNEERN